VCTAIGCIFRPTLPILSEKQCRAQNLSERPSGIRCHSERKKPLALERSEGEESAAFGCLRCFAKFMLRDSEVLTMTATRLLFG